MPASHPGLESLTHTLLPALAQTRVDFLAALSTSFNADWIDLMVVWMRSAGKGFVAFWTILLVSIATVCFIPSFLQAIALGYLWTYAYGGTAGVGIGGVAFLIGSWIGACVSYAIGASTLSARFAARPSSVLFGATLDNWEHVPLRLLLLLRTFPLTPSSLLNYYIGATQRFQFWQGFVTFPAFAPLAFMYVGIGGACLKIRLVNRGEISSTKYTPYIFLGLGLALVFTLAAIFAVIFSFRRGKNGSGAQHIAVDAGQVKMTTSTSHVAATDADTIEKGEQRASLVNSEQVVGGAQPPPPAPPPPPENMKPGWRQVLDEEGSPYFFNDDTGESQVRRVSNALLIDSHSTRQLQLSLTTLLLVGSGTHRSQMMR